LVNDNLKGQYIRFRFVFKGTKRTDNNATNVAVKAVEIKEDKLCQTPTNLAQTINQTITTQFPITWSDPNPTQAPSYIVTYRRSGATGDWTQKTVNNTNATLTGLRSSTTYAVYVTAVCGADEESYPTDTTYFTTAYTFPYSEPMAQRDTVIKLQGTNATIPMYSPFPGKPLLSYIPRTDGGVNTYTGQMPVQGSGGTADITLANGDGSNKQVFSHQTTYNKVANVMMDDGNGVQRLQLKAVGVGEQANYTWLITPVIYTMNLEQGEPLVVRFKARSAARSGGAGNPWTKGSVGSKYSSASLRVLVSNTGDFGHSNVIGTVAVGTETDIDGKEYEFDLPSKVTGSVQVAFYYANTDYINPNNQSAIENNDDYMTFEIFDVRFEYKNDVALCPPLEGLERTSLTPHSATYEWAPSDSAKYYEFTYGPVESEESGEDWHTVKLTEAQYTITGLEAEATYKVRVTGYCDAEGENAAPDPLEDEFTTPEGCQVPTGFKVQDVTYSGATFISKQSQSKTILEKREISVVASDEEVNFSKVFTQAKAQDTLVQEKGLYDNTSYKARTRAICRYGAGSVDTSAWTNYITFATPVDPANLPDTFDVRVVIAPAGAGSVSGAKKYVEDETITLKATPNTGYLFKAWVDANNDTVGRNATYTRLAKLEEDEENASVKTHVLEYRAVFRKVYTVTLNTSPAGTTGGTVTGAGTYDAGKPVSISATPKSAYVFSEWQDAAGESVSTLPTYTFTPTADVTYTAVFRLKEYYTLEAVVSPNADWGSVTFNPQPNEDDQYAEGCAVTMTAVPAQFCKFVEWQDMDGNVLGTNTTYTVSMDNNNKKVKAVFAQLRYQVTLVSNPSTTYGTIKGTSGSTTTGGTFVAGTTRRLVAQPKSGYAFVKWMSGTKELGTDTVFTFVLSRDTTITAYFKEKDSLSVKVTVEPVAAGTVTGAGKVKRGENAVLTATPAAHYAFKEWRRLDNSTVKSNPYTFKPERDYTFTAVFRNLETYTITVTTEGTGGTVSGTGSYEEGADVTVTATAAENHYFVEWQDEEGSTLSTDETYTFKAEGDATVKAVFSEDDKYTVTLQRSPSSAAGTVSGAGSYFENDQVTITATPNKGYRFLHWLKKDGTQVTDNPYIFNALGRDMVFTAVFEALCEIKTSVEPAGSATVKGAGTYEVGDEVKLTATVDDNYVFVEWRDATSGMTLSTANPYTFTASTSKNIKAVLRDKYYFSVDVPCVSDDDEDENDPGNVSIPGGEEGEWMEGSTVTMTAKPAQYYA
ncbi:MAG: fibronectin type III domain-containing protein, partial [Bacteroidales bacterium]|nr:fibronectin type III domain-containing protein [Bacteroidales bacterium]